ncbi:MAG TPA: hypothetical protein VFF27_03090 [Bacteroidia bacterium]|jgi:predicted metalloprotease with PDZ domain|nr:hypothetical protein [Bacteroidia bacterium]
MNFKKLTLLLLVFVTLQTGYAQKYTYTLDLVNVKKDRVKVTCMVPQQNIDEVNFIFPNVIPGSYALKEYGRYITHFKAYDENGKKLKLKKADRYNYTILNAKRLKKIEYSVDDSWEEKDGEHFIFQPGGTNISAGSNFVINNYGFFGYVEGMKNVPYEITIQKPANLKGYSYLPITTTSNTTDQLTVNTYDLLADSPIMYCPPQDATFKIGNTEISACVFSENNKITATQVTEILKPIAKALEHFFGTLPVDRYVFMFYLADANKIPKRKGKGLGSGFGALEHNHCSFYFMPENYGYEGLKENLSQVCAHEFLHIFTPLNLHSKEIEDFNFRVPVMSKHLWMYEGVTEYFSQIIQLQDSLITEDAFIEEMKSKINSSKEFDSFSMTQMSKDVITPENQARYLSVYSRGAVLGMLLDILIIDNSNGTNSLRQVLMELTKKYGQSKPFNDDDLIPEIIALTSPEVGDFFKRYIVGSETPDYNTYFNKIGYEFSPTFKRTVYYFGRVGLKYIEKTKQFEFTGVEDNLFGIQNHDIWVSVNDKEVNMETVSDLFVKTFRDNLSTDRVSITIMRDGKKMNFIAKPEPATQTLTDYLGPAAEVSEKAKANFKKFTEKAH